MMCDENCIDEGFLHVQQTMCQLSGDVQVSPKQRTGYLVNPLGTVGFKKGGEKLLLAVYPQGHLPPTGHDGGDHQVCPVLGGGAPVHEASCVDGHSVLHHWVGNAGGKGRGAQVGAAPRTFPARFPELSRPFSARFTHHWQRWISLCATAQTRCPPRAPYSRLRSARLRSGALHLGKPS
ncbi:hypothetical protein C2845_PM13G06840 [Panicum miliaceum]|uniref:Uncharacterized protein n=1 Tax=Panicum miliaceum TaxID=4540 RepID=A0A3L6RKG4_PANMI|nr:hypothetical protein C2845_PM13G06840 [Panicum miliaceum]